MILEEYNFLYKIFIYLYILYKTTQIIMKMNNYVILIMIIVLSLGLGLSLFYTTIFKSNKKVENYQNYDINNNVPTSLGGYEGKYPSSETALLVEDSYPLTGRKGISNNGASNIWWHYPTFQLGSYDQITNNIKYPNNPDEGTCMPASMCGALYKETQLKSNYIKPLPPINPECGTRVGYFDTNINLLPFRNDMANILY